MPATGCGGSVWTRPVEVTFVEVLQTTMDLSSFALWRGRMDSSSTNPFGFSAPLDTFPLTQQKAAAP